MAESLAKRVLAAAGLRLRPAKVNIGGGEFNINFRVYPADELAEILKSLRSKDTLAAAGLLAEQMTDPADGRPFLTAQELSGIPNCDLLALTEGFLAANGIGDTRQKN